MTSFKSILAIVKRGSMNECKIFVFSEFNISDITDQYQVAFLFHKHHLSDLFNMLKKLFLNELIKNWESVFFFWKRLGKIVSVFICFILTSLGIKQRFYSNSISVKDYFKIVQESVPG